MDELNELMLPGLAEKKDKGEKKDKKMIKRKRKKIRNRVCEIKK